MSNNHEQLPLTENDINHSKKSKCSKLNCNYNICSCNKEHPIYPFFIIIYVLCTFSLIVYILYIFVMYIINTDNYPLDIPINEKNFTIICALGMVIIIHVNGIIIGVQLKIHVY